MPRINEYPPPKKRYHGGRWRIYWKWNTRQYSLPTKHLDKQRPGAVDHDLRLVSAALAMDEPKFPYPYDSSPSVAAYLRDRGLLSAPTDPGGWIEDFRHEIEGRNTSGWVKDSVAMLRRLESIVGGDLSGVSAKQSSEFVAGLAKTHSIGTRNRNLTVFKQFYKWAVNTERATANPFAHIKRLKEERTGDIVYSTREEMASLIDLALETGLSEWMAIPIAFYSGMRRSEIANLKWKDVHMGEGTLVVAKSKTGESRTVPMSGKLAEYLELTPPRYRIGFVVSCPEETVRDVRLANLITRMRTRMRWKLVAASGVERPAPSRSKEFKEKYKAYLEAKARLETEIGEAEDRIGWNPFRHTFASLLVQSGVDVDTVSTWMGNTPEVCRRHYARFVPKDRRDTRIDLI